MGCKSGDLPGGIFDVGFVHMTRYVPVHVVLRIVSSFAMHHPV